MDDGSRMAPSGAGCVVTVVYGINGIFYGFAAAVRNISENEIDKKAEEGDPKAKLLKELLEDPSTVCQCHSFDRDSFGSMFRSISCTLGLLSISHRYIKHLPALILISAVCVVVFCISGYSYLPQDRNLPAGKICLPLCKVCVPGGKDSVSIYCVYYMDCQTGSQYRSEFQPVKNRMQ